MHEMHLPPPLQITPLQLQNLFSFDHLLAGSFPIVFVTNTLLLNLKTPLSKCCSIIIESAFVEIISYIVPNLRAMFQPFF